jgi:predicted DNA binding CopG/RHH family protein
MRKPYDVSKARANPYPKRLKRSVTIRLDEATIAYFKVLAGTSEIPSQTLISLYLRDCAAQKKKVSVRWLPGARGAA